MVGYLVLTTLEWMDLQMPRIENDIQKYSTMRKILGIPRYFCQ